MTKRYDRDLIGYGPHPPDPKWPGMYRLRLPDGSLTNMANLTRIKDALAEMRGRS